MRRVTALVLTFGCATNTFKSAEGEGEGDGECSLGEVRCSPDDGRAFERCDEAVVWQADGRCAGDCEDGSCTGERCESEDDDRCTAEGLREDCDPHVGGYRYPAACPSGQACWRDDCRDYLCSPLAIACDTGVPQQCNAVGSAQAPLQDGPCPELCVDGIGCRTYCEVAEDQHTSVGCTFYAFDSDLNDSDDSYGYNLMIANTDATQTALVEVKVRDAAGGWTTLGTREVEPLQAVDWLAACSSYCWTAALGPDRHLEGTGIAQGLAFKVTSTRPVVVYQMNSDDYQAIGGSPGASIVLPKSALDTQYYALTWPHCGGYQGHFTVIGTEDATNVTVRLSMSGGSAAGGVVPAIAAGGSYETTLDEGEMLQLGTDGGTSDLSGAKIVTDKPVAVYAGHEDACPVPLPYSGDAMLEAMLPLVAWGKEFVAAAAPHGRPYYYETLWRILASEDDTTVTIENPAGLPGLPPGPVVLDATQILQFLVTGNAANPGEFFISADKPIQPAQALAGETAYVLAVPVEQFLPDYVFLTTLYYYDERVTLIRPGGISVTVDGFEPAGTWYAAGGGYEVQQVVVATDTTHFIESLAGLKGDPVGILVSGNGGSCSFAYIGGLSQERINVLQ
ncbi:MAG: IgGFc-binding protein [Myxococcota bacterium]